MKRSRSLIWRLGGLLIVAIACVFVIQRLIASNVWDGIAGNGPGLIAALAIGGVVYALSGFLLAEAWLRLLRISGAPKAPRRDSLGIYARTQIAKYLPGNVFHFVGRHISGRGLGIDHGTMLYATWFESVGLISAAAVLALLGLSIWGGSESLAPWMAVGLAILVLCIPFAMAAALPTLTRLLKLAPPTTSRDRGMVEAALRLVPSYLLQCLFFASAGILLWLLGRALGGNPPIMIAAFIAATAGAWIGGFVVPGAAAGIGVREALLIVALTAIDVRNAELIAVSFRAVTLTGDLFFFLMGLALFRREPEIVAPSPEGPALLTDRR
ncbi:MAG: hypothetical protein HKM95_02205 [Inquilinus sp.]|nr:hypothetical protein [Inquilinus sp.]